jgi:hypothetical protein
MLQIKPYQSQVQLNTTRNVSATAASFGSESARALGRFGGEAERTASAVASVEESKSRIRAANFMSTADLNWRQQMIDMQNDPEFSQKYGDDGSMFADSFKDQFEQYAQEQISEVDPRDRKYIEQGMYNLGESLMGSAMDYQAQVGAKYTSDTLTKSISNGSVSARLSPGQYTSILANATMAVNTADNIDPITRRRFNEAAVQDITVGAALGQLEKGGVVAANAIKNGSMSFTALDEKGKPVQKSLRELVDSRTFDILNNQADSVIRKAESESKQVVSDMKSDIDTQIEFAETPDDFMAASKLIEQNADVFGTKDLNSMRVKLYKKSKEIREDYKSVDRGSAFASGDAYLNPSVPKDVEAFNNYYNKRVAPVLGDMEPGERNTYLANMVNNTKMMPKALKGDLQVAARTNDPKQIAVAADFIDRVRMTNPHLIGDIDQRTLARIDMVNNKMASGLTAEQAIEQVDTALDVSNKAVFEKRNTELKDSAVDYETMALDNFRSNWLVRALPGDSGSVEDYTSEMATRQIAQMTTEYRAAYETQYRLTGDAESAAKYANGVVSGLYGTTQVNGANQLMRHAPEKYFGIDGVDNGWMREQIVEEATAALASSWTDPDLKPENAMLIPAPHVTPRTAKNGRPLYKLMVLSKEGGYVDLLGANKYFTFDKNKKVQQLIEKAKEGPAPFDPSDRFPGAN